MVPLDSLKFSWGSLGVTLGSLRFLRFTQGYLGLFKVPLGSLGLLRDLLGSCRVPQGLLPKIDGWQPTVGQN